MTAVRPRIWLSTFAFALVCAGVAANACGGDDAVTPLDAGRDTAPPLPTDAARPDVATPPPRDAGVDTGCVPDPGPGDSGIPLVGDASDDDSGNPLPDAAAFDLAHALAGYPTTDGGVLTARIDTELGQIVCKLDEANAPITVANFVGLARGTRPYLGDGGWQRGKFYDGLLWHRVVPEFVIQGGDPRGNGTGGPGYVIPNENHAPQDLGVLAMAASQAPDSGELVPSGSQLFIVVGTGPKPDYNVFGSCTFDVAQAISNVERRASDKPRTPIHLTKVSIERCPK